MGTDHERVRGGCYPCAVRGTGRCGRPAPVACGRTVVVLRAGLAVLRVRVHVVHLA